MIEKEIVCPYCGFVNKLTFPLRHTYGYKEVVRCDNRKGGCFKEFALDIKIVITELKIDGENN